MTLSRYTGSMNSMFERLGALLKERLEGDEQDIFKDSKKINAENIETETERSSDNKTETQENAQTKNSEEKKDSQQNNFKFDTSKQQKSNLHSKKAEAFYKQYKAEKPEEKSYKIYKKNELKPMPLDVKKAFDFFVLSYTASFDECKKRYKKLIKAYHPDKHNSDPVKHKNASLHTAKLNEAFAKLKSWFETKN